MSALAKLYEDFHTAILADDPAHILPALKANPRLAPARQFAIYSEGYRLRLLQAIRADYPALLHLLEEPGFDWLALEYIKAQPPYHYNLDRYPHGFAAFAQSRLENDFAADLARVEAMIAELFMLEESAPLLPSALALAPEDFAALTLRPRLASRLLALRYPTEEYLSALREGRQASPPLRRESYLYLLRHENEVRRHALSEGEYRLLAALCEAMPVGEALDATLERYPVLAGEMEANLTAWFARWVQNGFFRQAEAL